MHGTHWKALCLLKCASQKEKKEHKMQTLGIKSRIQTGIKFDIGVIIYLFIFPFKSPSPK